MNPLANDFTESKVDTCKAITEYLLLIEAGTVMSFFCSIVHVILTTDYHIPTPKMRNWGRERFRDFLKVTQVGSQEQHQNPDLTPEPRVRI